MKLETAIHSFLAARYPAAFDSRTIKERVGRSGAVDGEISEAETINALCLLARRFGYVELITYADGSQYWSATTKGVSAWTVDGQPYVGG
jgi:hypothetical protein